MPNPPPRNRIEIRVPDAPTSEGADAVGRLRSRLGQFAKFTSMVTAGLLLIAFLVDLVSHRLWGEPPAFPQWELLLVVPGAYLLTWAVVRLWEPSLVALMIIDAASAVVSCAAMAVWGYNTGRVEQAFPAVSHLLLLRAALLPSSGRLTALISACAFLPSLLAGLLASEIVDPEPGATPMPGLVPLFLRCALWTAIAAVVSRVIYGLQREVHDARRFGQYTLESKIGEGGMGQVYRARHALLSRPTAIKLIHPDKASESMLRRFEREVEATSRLTHPNTVAIYDFGRTSSGVFYYAMEYLSGIDLATLVRRFGPQPAARIIHLLTQVCGSLHEAHSLGIVHRDIKPENLILCQQGGISDFVKVVDFGLVKDLRQPKDAGLTAPGAVIGTPLYMPAEGMNAAADMDSRSDLYSLGAVGYFLLTGKPPFTGANLFEIAVAQFNAEPKRPADVLGQPVPEDLEKVLLVCLSRDPTQRPKDAPALAQALSRCADAGTWQPEPADVWKKKHLPDAPAALRRKSDLTFPNPYPTPFPICRV